MQRGGFIFILFRANHITLFILFFLFIYFSIRVFFNRYWQITGQQGKGGGHDLFFSTTSTRSRTFRHLFATSHVRWLPRIFNRYSGCYSMRSTTLLNYLLIDWWCNICFSLLSWWWLDSTFLLQRETGGLELVIDRSCLFFP